MTSSISSRTLRTSASSSGLKKYSPLAALGYKTGIRASLKRERQRKLLRAFTVDLWEVLSEEEYLESGACLWGTSYSEQRKWQIVRHLRWQLGLQGMWGHHDAAQQLRVDLAFAERELDIRAQH